ncbi:chloride channel protein [Archangium sp.]|uniref:chloride channel protein n=1 Tax=Archangium sp. TaxID=1872627 RepID=UPI00286AE8A8|nr:chloride channel protein [Archangium sp.]
MDALRSESGARLELAEAFAEARWHFEYLIVGIPLGLGALGLARLILPGGPRDNEAALRALPLLLLATGCVLKLVATALTLGSGGSGGTFFPMTVMGALAGGAFGEVLHAAMPGITAPSGAYAMVGMGGAVAALTRGPLTGLMMVTCTIASGLCHALVERKAGGDVHALRRTPVKGLVTWVEPVGPELSVLVLRERLLTAPVAALPVRATDGQLVGVVPNAGHFSFQSPFPPAMTRPEFPPSQAPAGFDRVAFQPVLHAEILTFLRASLRSSKS